MNLHTLSIYGKAQYFKCADGIYLAIVDVMAFTHQIKGPIPAKKGCIEDPINEGVVNWLLSSATSISLEEFEKTIPRDSSEVYRREFDIALEGLTN